MEEKGREVLNRDSIREASELYSSIEEHEKTIAKLFDRMGASLKITLHMQDRKDKYFPDCEMIIPKSLIENCLSEKIVEDKKRLKQMGFSVEKKGKG